MIRTLGLAACAASQEVSQRWKELTQIPELDAQHVYTDYVRSVSAAIQRVHSLPVEVAYVTKSGNIDRLECWVECGHDHLIFFIQAPLFADKIEGAALAKRLLAVVPIFCMVAVESEVDLKFKVNLADNGSGADVAFCANSDDTVLIPDSDFLLTLGYEDFRRDVTKRWIDWTRRKKGIVWRGSSTGISRPKSTYKSFTEWFKERQRLELCALLENDPWKSVCNVGISAIVQVDDPELERRIRFHFLKDRIERLDQIAYQYLIDVDGNANAWSSLFQAFILGGCVLKVGSRYGFKQWYYNKIQPLREFIPIQSDFSDLEPQLEWSFSHPEQAKKIALAGQALAAQFTYEAECSRAAGALCRSRRMANTT